MAARVPGHAEPKGDDASSRLRAAGYLPILADEIWFVVGVDVMNTEQALAYLDADEAKA